MTAEEIAQLVESAVSRAVSAVLTGLQASSATIGGTSKSSTRRTLEPKGVSRVDTFTGNMDHGENGPSSFAWR